MAVDVRLFGHRLRAANGISNRGDDARRDLRPAWQAVITALPIAD
jgi:hypothetical protein